MNENLLNAFFNASMEHLDGMSAGANYHTNDFHSRRGRAEKLMNVAFKFGCGVASSARSLHASEAVGNSPTYRFAADSNL
jgi:hypothetical protein